MREGGREGGGWGGVLCYTKKKESTLFFYHFILSRCSFLILYCLKILLRGAEVVEGLLSLP